VFAGWGKRKQLFLSQISSARTFSLGRWCAVTFSVLSCQTQY